MGKKKKYKKCGKSEKRRQEWKKVRKQNRIVKEAVAVIKFPHISSLVQQQQQQTDIK